MMRFTSIVLIACFTGLGVISARAHSTDKISIAGGPGPLRLEVEGDIGQEYVIEGTSDVGDPTGWRELARLLLTRNQAEWTDETSVQVPFRFYRLARLVPVDRLEASNFRLLDQNGRSRELFYHWNQRAIVLVFLGQKCAEAEAVLPTIRAASELFGKQGVLFWLINSDASAPRASLAAQGGSLPVLHDTAQLVAREFNVTRAPEVVCIDVTDWKIFYRGLVDDRTATEPAVKHHLIHALTHFLAGEDVTPPRTTVAGCEIKTPPAPPVSYAADVAPLLLRHCANCHSRGNIAPFEMKDHAEVKRYALSIKEKLITGTMPPWHADPAYGQFANDVSLKPDELATLLHWLDDGAPRGDGADPLAEAASQPPLVDYPHAWPLAMGRPDYVVSIPRTEIPATGEVPYKYISVKIDIPTNTWLRAAVIQPGNTKVVHHALVFLGTLLDVFISGGGLGGYFAGYVPGQSAVEFPEGTAKLLPGNATVTFQMHYTPVGTSESDETRLGLYFAKAPPERELKTTAAFTTNLRILPGVTEYERTASVTPSPSKDFLLHELSPHMHYRGSRFRFEAVYPNGTSEILLSVPHYDFQWQTLYRLAQPKRLPAGTQIRCVGAFDNSPQNRYNPNPDALVTFGEQTDDEMFIGYLNYSELP